MDVELTIKNYRCFSDAKPARIRIRDGLIAFVGVNNAGKSTLLRFFYELRYLFQAAAAGQGVVNLPIEITDAHEIFFDGNGRDIEITLRLPSFPNVDVDLNLVAATDMTIHVIRPINPGRQSLVWDVTFGRDGKMYRGEEVGRSGDLLYHRQTSTNLLDLSDLVNSCAVLGNSLYIGPFRNAINLGSVESYFDIQVGQAFIKQWRRWKTGSIKQNSRAAIELTNRLKSIFNYDYLEINTSDDDENLQVIVDGKPYKLSELGSGFAQFVIVLANAVVKSPDFILIDEPELSLHPALQLDFLTVLASNAKTSTLFATHNYGLARGGADSIYLIRRDKQGNREVVDHNEMPRLSEFLGELGFSGYRDLGFDKVLLVEGTSDVRTIQQFLRLYGKEQEFLLLPLGGSLLINKEAPQQLEEIKRITPHVSALIDSERAASNAALASDRAAFKNRCEAADIRCHVLKYRALENYFSETAVQHALGPDTHALSPYEPLARRWPKAQNWNIARETTKQELEQTDLGAFLLSLIAPQP